MVQRLLSPADQIDFIGQNAHGSDAPRVKFTMRRGIVHTFAYLQQPQLVLAARLVPIVLENPMATLSEWKDLTRRGFPRNLMYTRTFGEEQVEIDGIVVNVPREFNVFGVNIDQDNRVVDYGWYEKCGRLGFPKGFDIPEICGGTLWQIP